MQETPLDCPGTRPIPSLTPSPNTLEHLVVIHYPETGGRSCLSGGLCEEILRCIDRERDRQRSADPPLAAHRHGGEPDGGPRVHDPVLYHPHDSLVLLVMAWIASGRSLPARLLLCVVLSITCVGLIYHLLLAHLNPLQGLALAADHGVHTVVPLLTVAWWLLWGEKPALRWSDSLLWVTWPLTYCAYALARAEFSGFYPYPFLDLSELGPAQLVVNLVSMTLAFAVVGLTLIGLGKVAEAARAKAANP